MSTQSLNILTDYFSNIFSVDTKSTEPLKEFLKRIRKDKKLSTTDVANASRRGGAKGVSSGYVSQIENDYVKNVSPEKLQALARGLGVSEEEIFAAARGASADLSKISNERFSLIAEGYSILPEQARENIEPLLSAIELAISKQKQTVQTKSTSKKQVSVSVAGKVKPRKPENGELNFSGSNKKKVSKEQTLFEELDTVLENKKNAK